MFMDWRTGTLETAILFTHELAILDLHIQRYHGAVIDYEATPRELSRWLYIPLFYCVSLVKHQLGVSWLSLTPQQLFHRLQAAGGQLVLDYRRT